MERLEGKRAIVTGAGQVSGAPSPSVCASEGARVALTDVDEDAAARWPRR